MKGLVKKSVGLVLVLVVCAMVLVPGIVQAADEDVPRVFKSAYVITPNADEDIPRIFTPDADEDVPRVFNSFPITTNADEDVPRVFK
jgi:hypothetical protein